MYNDAVVDEDYKVIFKDEPRYVLEWIKKNKPDSATHWVCVGKTVDFLRIEGYLRRMDEL